MSTQDPAATSIHSAQAADVEGFDSLAKLALDMHSSWNHGADILWRQLDPVLWELTHNPWVVLQTVAREQLVRTLGDATFRAKVNELVKAGEQSLATTAWFGRKHAQSPLSCVAYFSMNTC